MNKGLLLGLGAYVSWGLLPVYWKALAVVPSSEIILHRVLWSVVFLAAILTWQHNWRWIRPVLRAPQTMLILLVAALLLAINWTTYIWAVNAGFVVESSLGYFIAPLVNVVLGVLLLRERLRPGQWVAVGLATLGVLYLTLGYGSLPWIGLTLAFTFGLYGYLQKKVRLASLESLMVEVTYLSLPALALLLWRESNGEAVFLNTTAWINLLLLAAGAATALPLLFFGAAARLIPLSTMGLLQYVAPTLQFLLGVFVYAETFTTERFIGFCIIWLALLVYTVENAGHRRAARLQAREGQGAA